MTRIVTGVATGVDDGNACGDGKGVPVGEGVGVVRRLSGEPTGDGVVAIVVTGVAAAVTVERGRDAGVPVMDGTAVALVVVPVAVLVPGVVTIPGTVAVMRGTSAVAAGIAVGTTLVTAVLRGAMVALGVCFGAAVATRVTAVPPCFAAGVSATAP
jgi:hypothetical protein